MIEFSVFAIKLELLTELSDKVAKFPQSNPAL